MSRKDVILLEPWANSVVGWNPLETDEQSPYTPVRELVFILHHCLWPDAWGPRLEELLRMTLLALAAVGLTLLEATRFLTVPEFRRAVLARVTMPEVREFWTLRFERLSPSQRSLVVEPVLNKIAVFHDPMVRYLIGQQPGTLNLDRALQEGQTIIANFAAGALQGNTYLLAALLLAKFKSAVYRRPADAKPYAVFLDEFQEMLGW